MKSELKVYDQAFISRFGRIPSRTEKEPMRNLYMYYKRIKVSIVKRQQAAAANANGAAGKGQRSSSVASAGSAQSNITSGSRALSTNSAPNATGENKPGMDSDEDDGLARK